MNASAQGVLGKIIARKRPDTPSIEQEKCLPILGSAVESSEEPTAVVGRRSSGKSRFMDRLSCRRFTANAFRLVLSAVAYNPLRTYGAMQTGVCSMRCSRRMLTFSWPVNRRRCCGFMRVSLLFGVARQTADSMLPEIQGAPCSD